MNKKPKMLRYDFPKNTKEANFYDVEFRDEYGVFKIFEYIESVEGVVDDINIFLLKNGFDRIDVGDFIENDYSYISKDERVSLDKHSYQEAFVLHIEKFIILYQNYYKYQLFIAQKEGEKRFIKKKEFNGVACNFKSPVTDKNRPKIYVLKEGKDILYVGYTGQPVTSRLTSGIRADGKNGYHGYKWRDRNKLDLFVFIFEHFSTNSDIKKEQKLFVEAIEAELVFKIRLESSKWPLSQNEIHFNNDNFNNVREVTNIIYSEIIK